MTDYIGDIAVGADVYLVFDTADYTGASITGTIAVADIEVYRQNTGAINLTQRSSTTGFTLDVDHDAMIGTHMIAIDTSDNTDAGFFAVGYDYFVKLNTVTVDSISISKWIGHFSLENRYSAGALRPTTAGRALDVTATGAAGIDWANVENQSTAVDLSATDIQLADTITTYTGNTEQTADHTAALAIAQTDLDTITGTDGVTLATAQALYAPNKIAPDNASIASILSDTGELQTDDVPGLIAALNDVSTTDVLAQVNAALDTAIAELGVAAPAATPTLRTGLMLLYMALRNKTIVQTSGTDALEIHNDAGTKIASKLLTDDGDDYTENQLG